METQMKKNELEDRVPQAWRRCEKCPCSRLEIKFLVNHIDVCYKEGVCSLKEQKKSSIFSRIIRLRQTLLLGLSFWCSR